MMPEPSTSPGDSPFRRPGLFSRVWPFAAVAILAEASLALPPASHDWAAVTVSAALLLIVAAEFAMPWESLPAKLGVLVPLTYTGSALALTLAGGTVSGVGIIVLIPLIWTALFHRRWESACVVVAIIACEATVSAVQSADDAVTARRVLLWSALGVLLAVATHDLRDRIARSQREAERLHEQLAELKLVEDRDRMAAELQGGVAQRVFAAGLALSSVASMTSDDEVRHRVEASVADLDEAVRLLRRAVFATQEHADSG
jgi:signal transduction histidine kinase